jgi:hypothetical protein
MAEFQFDIDAVSADNREELEMRHALGKHLKQKKLQQRLKQEMGGQGSGMEAKLAQQAKQMEKEMKEQEKARKKENKVSAKDIQTMYAGIDAAKAKGLEKDRQKALRKIRLYLKLLPQAAEGNVPKNYTKLSIGDLNDILEAIRGELSLKNIKPQAHMTVVAAVKGLEWLVHEQNINPLGFSNIRGLAELIERNPATLETEISEMAVEMNGLFNQNCYLRLGMKLVGLALAFDRGAGQRKPQSSAQAAAAPDAMPAPPSFSSEELRAALEAEEAASQ